MHVSRTLIALLAVSFVSLSFFIPLLVSAQIGNPIWNGKYTVSCNVTGYCTLCDGLKIAANVVDFLTKIALAIAGAMVAYGGFRLLTSGGSSSSVGEGKKIVTGALIGLAIVLFSWVAVQTLLSLLSGGSLSLTNPVTCTPPPQPNIPPLGGGNLTPPTSQPATPDGYTYDSNIQQQMADASSQLSTLLTCMQSKLPTGAKRISSISDSAGIVRCIDNYARPPCAHAENSCHYGGVNCQGQYKSYAVDFGNEQYGGDIRNAVIACNTQAYVLQEGDHVHVSVGMASGCGCR